MFSRNDDVAASYDNYTIDNKRFRSVLLGKNHEKNENAAVGRRKLRILCFHGYGSNNDITEFQICSLGLPSHHGVICDLFEAKNTCQAQNYTLTKLSNNEFRTWAVLSLSSKVLGYLFGRSPTAESSFITSLYEIKRVIQQHGPYDGFYGFSMGASLVTCLLNPMVWKDMFGWSKCPVSFAILACGGGSHLISSFQIPVCGDQNRLQYGQEEANTNTNGTNDTDNHCNNNHKTTTTTSSPPTKTNGTKSLSTLEKISGVSTFHIIGAYDLIRNDSKSFISRFVDSTVYEAAVGHEIPMSLGGDAKLKEALTKFLSNQRS